MRVSTLKFSSIVKNNESFAWEKFDKILSGQTDQGQCHQVTVTQNIFVTKS
jgi:hypothetical protein